MVSTLISSFLELVYPKQCLHCCERLDDSLHLLCQGCLDLMPLSDPEDHCRSCYTFLEGAPCHQCLKNPSPFYRTLAAFSRSDSAQSLAHRLEHFNGAFLSRSMASFLAVQMQRQPMPSFDYLVPSSDKGSKRLAKSLSALLDIPYLDMIRPPSLIYPEGNLRKNREALMEKHVAYVSLGTKGFLQERHNGHLLLESLPSSLSALLFVRHQRL